MPLGHCDAVMAQGDGAAGVDGVVGDRSPGRLPKARVLAAHQSTGVGGPEFH
jgi:hypothetical protein